MYNPNDPVGKATEMGARLFALMSDEVVKAFGTEGEEAVRKAVRRYGTMRGQEIRRRILEDNREVSFQTAEEYSDYPENNAWDCEAEMGDKVLREFTRACPFSKAFRELGLETAGKLYCEEIDIALNTALFGPIRFERPRLFTEGDEAPCEMVITRIGDRREEEKP